MCVSVDAPLTSEALFLHVERLFLELISDPTNALSTAAPDLALKKPRQLGLTECLLGDNIHCCSPGMAGKDGLNLHKSMAV